jgi:hypothetical protein
VNTVLEEGKRYEWKIKRVKNGQVVRQNGLFTGEYLENGNAVFQTKSGDEWSLPESSVWEYKKGK